MASYNGDFNRMQEEALARLREMQRRSRTAVNQPRPQAPPPPAYPEPELHTQPQQQQHQQHQSHMQRQNPPQIHNAPPTDIFKNLLGDMKIDSEKALILLMLYVLYKNKADMKLLLALGYLLI